MQLVLSILMLISTIVILMQLTDCLKIPGNNPLRNSTEFLVNSIGEKVVRGQISAPIFKLERCDQVIFVKGQRFADYTDFLKRKDSFFEIGIYIISVFESNDNEKLIASIDWNNLAKMPNYITGTKTCLDVLEKNNIHRFSICLESEEIMNQIIEVFKDFAKCREGFNLVYPKEKNCTLMLKEWQNGALVNSNYTLSDEEMHKMKIKNSKNVVNPYYDINKIPGS